MQASTKELIVVESLNPVELFAGDGLEPLLNRIETEVRSYLLDISTDAGRKEVASVAFKVARSKTTLDKMGKDLGEEYRQKINALNAKRNVAVTRLESLQHEIRKPLTDWENAEKARVDKHQEGIADIKRLDIWHPHSPAINIQQSIERLSDFHGRDWQEFDSMAKTTIRQVFESLTKKLEESKRHEAERAELARLHEAEPQRLRAEAEAVKAAQSEPVAPTGVLIRFPKTPMIIIPREAANGAQPIPATPVKFPPLAPGDDLAAKNSEALKALEQFMDAKTALRLLAAIAQGQIPHVRINY